MLRFFTLPGIGIEITSTAVRLSVVGRSGKGPVVHESRTKDLPPGVVTESYASTVMSDPERLRDVLWPALDGLSSFRTRRVGLSLPDALFRIQTLEFDELPAGAADREKLIRWRLEKSAAFDMSGTALRFQVRERPERGNIVLASVAKQEMIASFEDLLSRLGFEVWTIAPSSFSVLNFYAPYLGTRSGTYALARLAGGSYSTIIVDGGIPCFYRYREIKAAAQEEVVGRLVRELDDTLHFYMHRDRDQPSEVGHLFVSGESGMIDGLSHALKGGTTMEIERLSPRSVIGTLGDEQGMMAAAFGAGGLR